MQRSYSLEEIARHVDADLVEPQQGHRRIDSIRPLADAGESDLAFVASVLYLGDLERTRAGAVLLKPEHASLCPTTALICTDPYLAYARISGWFAPAAVAEPGVHPGAIVAPGAVLGERVCIGARAVVETGVTLERDVVIGPGCFVGRGVSIGEGSVLHANVSLYHDVQIGRRAIIHAGAVIGADGFGFARGPSGWEKIHQLGRVIVGDDVEIGANTTIDRGALDDTVIGNGVKIDDLVMVAHNVRIGDRCALAGQTGIAGSSRLGRDCILAGNSGLVGHIELCDGVVVTGKTMITKSISHPGSYSSGTPFMESTEWKRNAVRFAQLEKLNQRLRQLEKQQKK